MPVQAEDRHTQFFEKLGEALSQGSTEGELIEILKLHLLLSNPDENCIENAKAAILQLAANRAASKKQGTDE